MKKKNRFDIDATDEASEKKGKKGGKKDKKDKKDKKAKKDKSADGAKMPIKLPFASLFAPKVKKTNNVIIGFDRDLTQCRIMRIFAADISTVTVENINLKAKRADVPFFTALQDHFSSYMSDKPFEQSSAVHLILNNSMVALDRIAIPTMKKSMMKSALATDYNSLYINSKDLQMTSYVSAQSKSIVQYNVLSVQKSLLGDFYKVLANGKLYAKSTTYSASSTINAVLYLRPKCRGRSFFFVDMKEDYTVLISVGKGKAMGFANIPYGYKLLTQQRVQYEPALADHPEAELAVITAKEKAKSQSGMSNTAEAVNNDVQATAEEIILTKSQKRVPKFLQRPIPETKEGIPIENFRIILKWILLYVRQNAMSDSLPTPEFVMVNVPKEYNYVIEALNGEEEKKENGIEFRPFYPETENRPEITYNLDLFGGIFTQMYNTQNNI